MKRPALLVCLLACLVLAGMAWLLSMPSRRSGGGDLSSAPGAISTDRMKADRMLEGRSSIALGKEERSDSSPSAQSDAADRVAIEVPAEEAEDPPLLVGTVLESDGSPAVGARVFARTGGWYSVVPIELEQSEGSSVGQQQTRTGNDGRFEFREGLEVGSALALSVVHEQHATERMLRVPFRFAPHDLGLIQLRQGLSLSGFVRREDGAPLADVDVLLSAQRGVGGLEGSFSGQGTPAARTDGDGSFRVDSLAPGNWHLLFDAEGMQVAERWGQELLANSIELEDVVLSPGHRIEGTIVDLPPDRAPNLRIEARCEEIEPASLRRPRSARPDASGAFQIAGVAPHARTRVRVLSQNESGEWLPAPEVAPVVVESDTTSLRLEWGQPLSLRARVVDAAGIPIEHYSAFTQLGYFGGTHEIGGEGSDESLTHHPNGELHAQGMRLYSEERIPSLIIRAVGYQDYEREVEGLVPGRVVTLGDLTLTPAPMLRVRVHDPSGTPIAGAKIELEAESRRTQEAETDGEGMALLNAIAGVPSTLHVRHERWSDAQRKIPAALDSESTVQIQLQEGCALTALVTSPNGAALEGHTVEATPLLPNLEPAPEASALKRGSDREGRVEWSGLRAGTWRVRRVPHVREWREFAQQPAPGQIVTLSPDTAVVVELAARPESPVTGIVRDSRGVLPTATLRLRPLDDRNGRTGDRGAWQSAYNRLSNAFGEFRFERIPHGEYQLEIEHDRRAMVALFETVVSEHSKPLDIELPDTSFRVRVVDEGGMPVADATVELDAGDSRYGGWNDARRAWTDERGDLQQAWHEDCVNRRESGADGWTNFDGCVPDVPVTLRLKGRWTAAASVTVQAQRAGEVGIAAEELVWRAAGEVIVVTVGESSCGWRVHCIPLGPDGAPEHGLDHMQEGSSEKITFWSCRAGPCRLDLEIQNEEKEWEQAATIEVTVPAQRALVLEAKLATGTLAVQSDVEPKSN